MLKLLPQNLACRCKNADGIPQALQAATKLDKVLQDAFGSEGSKMAQMDERWAASASLHPRWHPSHLWLRASSLLQMMLGVLTRLLQREGFLETLYAGPMFHNVNHKG